MEAKEVARRLVEESIVLLKNEEQALPFSKGQRAAFFRKVSD